MRKNSDGRNGLAGREQSRRLLLAAMGLASSAFGQTPLYFDNNGATNNLGTGTGVWDLTTAKWATSATPGTTAPGVWVQGDIADFDAADVAQVAPNMDIQLNGITFDAGSGSAGTPNITASAATSPAVLGDLNFGSGTFTINQNTSSKQFIAAPIVGSANVIINTTKAATAMDGASVGFAGNMSGFTGSITLNNAFASPTLTNAATLHVDTSLSGGTINLDEDTSLYNSSQITGAGTTGDPWNNVTGKSPNYFTISDNIVLNYNAAHENGATNVTNNIGGSNGPSGTSKVMVLSGIISSPTAGTTLDGQPIVSNLNFGGQSTLGTIVLANHETYNGSTTIAVTNGNGMVQLAAENALPSTTALIIGSGSVSVGVTDLDGFDETVSSLATGTSQTGATQVGNIYNLSVNNSTLSFQENTSANPATLTITPAVTTSTTFKGDIGDTTLAAPLTNTAPFTGFTQANTNISVVLNGPTGGGTSTLNLSPVGTLSNGDEYNGSTTINSNATLIVGRVSSYSQGSSPGNAYTVTGNGTVTVNNGGTLASATSTFGGSPTYVGGFGGQITLNSGSSMVPGGVGGTALLVTGGSINFNSGASMSFDLSTPSNYDQIVANGGVQLDSVSGTHTINVSLASGASLVAGNYDLIVGNINGDDSNSDGFTLNTSSISAGSDTFKLIDVNSALVLEVLAPALRWDPTGQGEVPNPTNSLIGGEGPGTWTDGSTFVDLSQSPSVEANWSNTAYPTYNVQIGGDNSGNSIGGPITLEEDITVGGELRFGAMYPGYNYSIEGNGHSLILNGGMVVATGAATYDSNGTKLTPSAAIDAPIVLGADQTWEIDSGEFLDVTGSLTGNQTLTVVGTAGSTNGGVLDLHASGSIGTLDVNGGIVLLGAADAIGATTPINLNGGGVEFGINGTPSNPIAIGPSGGGLGATDNGGAPYNVTFGADFTAGYPMAAIGTGNTTFNGNINASTFTAAGNPVFGGGAVTLNGTNTFGAIAITSGTLIASSPAALSSSTTPMISLGPISGNNGGNLSILGFTTLPNNIYLGTNGGANMSIIDNVSGSGGLILSGNISGSGNFGLNMPEVTLSGNNSNTNSVGFSYAGMLVHVTSATAFGTASIRTDQNSTLDVEVNVTANDIRGAQTTASSPSTLTKTGPGTLTLTGTAATPSYPGSAVVIDQGELVMKAFHELMSSASGATSLNITVNPGAILAADFDSSTARTGGTVTFTGTALSPATLVHDSTDTGDSRFQAASASDVWTINGNVLLREGQNGAASASQILRVFNPVVVTSGAVLTLESDDSSGNFNDDSLVISGPANLTTNGSTAPDNYNTFTIQPGATVVESGPGNIRFGQASSNGIPIIGKGTPNNALPNNGEALMQLGSNFFMVDTAASNEMFTSLVVNGSGGEGLRIEAPMTAAYTSTTIGTTGLFGIDPHGPINVNVYTVLSPNRAMAISNSYNDGTNTITPSGTLTLAANDAGDATGLISAGPAAACAVTLALDNTATSSGTHIYQIDPASPAGGNFKNFAGLAVKRTYPGGAAVTAQLQINSGNTLVHALSITGGAKLDITNQALEVDPAAGPAPTAGVLALLQSAYDNGNWDGPGIGSSLFTNGTAQLGTSIGYAENDLLPTPFDSASNFFGGASGQGVDNFAVLIRYTWLGDLNLDGVVDSADYDMMGGDLGGTTTGWINGDLNYDGVVNADDWALFMLGNQAQTGQLTSFVPEPAAMSLLAIGAGAMLRRRRRD